MLRATPSSSMEVAERSRIVDSTRGLGQQVDRLLANERGRAFALAAGFARTDADRRPLSQIPKRELLEGFGA
jgi:hypothetical protein